MKRINNNLILVLAILAFIFSFSSVSARTVMVESGVDFNPYTSYTYQSPAPSNPYTYNQYNQYPYGYVIPGCEGRNTGYSTTTGQSCVGNYINNSTNGNNNYTNNSGSGNGSFIESKNNLSSKTSSSTSSSTNTSTTTTTDNTVSKSSKSNSGSLAKSDINENYGSLTANALFGSNSFIPTGIFQWILLAIIIAVIIFLWRYIHAEEKYMSEPLKHA